MALLLNTPVNQTLQGYAVINAQFDFQNNLVSVMYAPIVGGATQLSNTQGTPGMTEAAFLALTGATMRLKAEAAVAAAVGLGAGTFTVA